MVVVVVVVVQLCLALSWPSYKPEVTTEWWPPLGLHHTTSTPALLCTVPGHELWPEKDTIRDNLQIGVSSLESLEINISNKI